MKFVFVAASIALTASLGACSLIRHDVAPSLAASACTERQFNIYFEDAETELSREARDAIAAVDRSLRGCQIDRVRIVGLAHAPVDPNENMELSQARAERVAMYLQSTTSWPRSAFELVARGEHNAVNDEGLERPMRRRARVTVTAVAPPRPS